MGPEGSDWLGGSLICLNAAFCEDKGGPAATFFDGMIALRSIVAGRVLRWSDLDGGEDHGSPLANNVQG